MITVPDFKKAMSVFYKDKDEPTPPPQKQVLNWLIDDIYGQLNTLTGYNGTPEPYSMEDPVYSRRLIQYQINKNVSIPEPNRHIDDIRLHFFCVYQNMSMPPDLLSKTRSKKYHQLHDHGIVYDRNEVYDGQYGFLYSLPFYGDYEYINDALHTKWFNMYKMYHVITQMYPNVRLYYPFDINVINSSNSCGVIMKTLVDAMFLAYENTLEGFFNTRIMRAKCGEPTNHSYSWYKVFSEKFVDNYDEEWSMRPYVSLDVHVPGINRPFQHIYDLHDNYNPMNLRILCFPYQKILICSDVIGEDYTYPEWDDVRRNPAPYSLIELMKEEYPKYYSVHYRDNTVDALQDGIRDLIRILVSRDSMKCIMDITPYNTTTCPCIPITKSTNRIVCTYGNLMSNMVVNVKDHDSNTNYAFMFTRSGMNGRSLFSIKDLPFTDLSLLVNMNERNGAMKEIEVTRERLLKFKNLVLEFKAQHFRRNNYLDVIMKNVFTDLFQRCIDEAYLGLVRKERVLMVKGFFHYPEYKHMLLVVEGKRFGDPTRNTDKSFYRDSFGKFDLDTSSFENFISTFRLVMNRFQFHKFYNPLILKKEKEAIRSSEKYYNHPHRHLARIPFKIFTKRVKEDPSFLNALRPMYDSIMEVVNSFYARDDIQELLDKINECHKTLTDLYLNRVNNYEWNQHHTSQLEYCSSFEQFVEEANKRLHSDLVCYKIK